MSKFINHNREIYLKEKINNKNNKVNFLKKKIKNLNFKTNDPKILYNKLITLKLYNFLLRNYLSKSDLLPPFKLNEFPRSKLKKNFKILTHNIEIKEEDIPDFIKYIKGEGKDDKND